MKTLVALSAILMTSSGQILSQPPPQLSLISPSAPRLWYPTFQTGGVSLRTDLGSCADDMIQASKNHERASTILTQARRIQKWIALTNKMRDWVLSSSGLRMAPNVLMGSMKELLSTSSDTARAHSNATATPLTF